MFYDRRPLTNSRYLVAALILMPGLLLAFSGGSTAIAEDQGEFESGPWISSVAWVDDKTLVGTQSQGLLLRPASVVKASADKPSELEELGQAETSLWSVISAGNGKYLASDYKGGLAMYGDGESRPLEIESRWVRALEVAPDGELCVAGTEDGKLIAINLADGTEKQRVEAGGAAIFDIAFHPAGDQLAISCGDGAVRLFSWPGMEAAGEMSRGSNALWSLVYSQDGSLIISGGADRRLQLWDVAGKKSKMTLTKTPDWVTSLVHLPDSSLVVAGCMDGSVVVADYAALIPISHTEWTESGIWGLALSPDGKTLAAGTRKSGIALRSVDDWRSQATEVVTSFATEVPPKP